MSVRVQAWGIIAAVLADPDPSGAAVRQRLSNSLDENPGVPERALLEYLLETRRSDANTVETLDSARKMRLEPTAIPPKLAE
jgi:5S rRNA maturation endonuclease (ribonuclease M5)